MKVFILKNVKGLIAYDRDKIFEEIIAFHAFAGYNDSINKINFSANDADHLKTKYIE